MSRIGVANAPCSWGVLEFDRETQAGWERVLDEMAAAGYAGPELGDWGFMPTDPARLGDELARRALAMVGAFVPVFLSDESAHAAGAEVAVRTARLLAAVAERPVLVLADENGRVADRVRHAGRVSPGLGLSAEAWHTFARGADRIAARVREATGVRTVFHHHCAGYVETPEEIDRLMELTDPSLLGLCLDTGHHLFGSHGRGDPLGTLRRHGDRVWHVHFKDCDTSVVASAHTKDWDYFAAVGNGVFCELGRGSSVSSPDAATTAGSSWSRTCCRGWGRRSRARDGTGRL
jgi:inosose dehydratase